MGEFKPVEIIQALAGSGKTQLLAYRFLRLMKLGADPATILATTFSRKAAGEIRDRIVKMLSDAILTEDGFNQLIIGVPEISTDLEEGQKECAILLRQLVSTIHRLNIGTIDSFFVKTALAFSDTLELSQGWNILDEVHEDQIFSEAIHRLTKDASKTKQFATMLRLSKSGAKVPINRTVHGIKDDSYAAVRGADTPVWVWGEKLQTISNQAVFDAISEVATLQLQNKNQLKAVTKAVEQMQNGDWKSFLTSGIAPKIIDGSLRYYNKDVEDGIEEAYQPLINHGFSVMANRMLAKNKNTYELMKELNTSWLDAKHHRGFYSFDDVTFQLSNSEIMHKLEELQFRMDGSIDHMLVDEFQDTSITQWRVLEPLVHEINQATNDRSLFFVGDVKQSLYGFRGGEPALLRGLEEELIHAETTRLDSSWRCTPPILEAVNKVFGNVETANLLTEHAPDAAVTWSDDFVPHCSAAPIQALAGYADIQVADVNPDKTTLQLCVDKVVEVVAKIYADAPAATVGILVRSNTKQQIQRIVHALRSSEFDIPASEFGGNPLTDSPAVTLILSALLVADDHCNSVHTFHVNSSPLGSYLGLSYPANRVQIDKLSASIRRKLLKVGYANLINEYAEQLVEHVDNRERLRLWQLVEFAEAYAADKTLRPSEFVRIVREVPVADPASSQVQVMTIHKSKGLSFDAVVVCDFDQAIWKTPDMMEFHPNPCKDPIRVGLYASDYLDEVIPEYKEMRDESRQAQVNDAICLLYVAMTRAKRAMHMILPCRESATSHHKKLDGLLLQLLEENQAQEPNSVVWTSKGSNQNWVDDFKTLTEEKKTEFEPFSILAPKDAIAIGKGIASASPSSLEGGGIVDIGERFAGGTNTAFDLGTITHQWLEDIEWLYEIPSTECLIESAPIDEASRVCSTKLLSAANRCIHALQSDEIKQLLTLPKESVDVYREQEFVLRVKKGEKFTNVTMREPTDIRGSIDRLVVYKDESGSIVRAEVIDWKTDKIEPEELENKIMHYAPQLSSYRLAAARLLGIDREYVTTKLVFISIKKVIDMTDKT
jgi:ATP-dependent helicase/nuclease subunit A